MYFVLDAYAVQVLLDVVHTTVSFTLGMSGIEFDKAGAELRDLSFAYVTDEPGTFARRGGVLDLFPAERVQPVRVEFYGDEIESIREFDQESQRSMQFKFISNLCRTLIFFRIQITKIPIDQKI